MFGIAKGSLHAFAALSAQRALFQPSGGAFACLQLCPRSIMSPALQSPLVWDGSGTQAELMQKDECITVDEADTITGSANKHEAHRFTPQQPAGRLHRAFSVFLFAPDGRLLLQQRALSKITFPGVWTNTCCSHPLHGYEPSEVDGPEDIAGGTVMGAKRAAVRKLGHELGIPAEQLPLSGFHFLTRLHYCAADTGTYGPDAEWGEHEVDYILFMRAAVDLAPNPEEVAATRYVDAAELRSMMAPRSGLQWSPWFRIIARSFLDAWWADLDGVLSGRTHRDVHTIHRIL